MSSSALTNSDKKCGIYKLEFPDGKFYIGSSKDIDHRVCSHKNALLSGKHKNIRISSAWNMHKEITHSVVLLCMDIDLIDYEQACLDKFNPPLNILPIAGRMVHTPEVRAKLCISQKARYAKLGAREKRSKIAKEVTNRPEVRAKMSIARTGKKFPRRPGWVMSDKGKKNLSIAASKRWSSREERLKQADRRRSRKASLGAKANMSKSAKIAWISRKRGASCQQPV